MDSQQIQQELEQQANKAQAMVIQIIPEKGKRGLMYAGLAILLLAACGFAYKLFFYHAPATGIYSTAAPAKGMQNAITHETAPVKLRAYDKNQVTRKMDLPASLIADPREVTATAQMKPSEGGYTAAAVTDTQTGVTEIVVKEEARPLFGWGGKTEVGALAGVATSGDAAIIYAKQDILRIGPVNLGAVGGAGTIGGKIGAGAFVDISVRW